MFRPALMQRTYPLQLAQHLHRDVISHPLRVAELEIQHRLTEIRIGLAVGKQIARAAQQLRLFLMLLQPVCHFAVCAPVGEHPY